MKRTLLLLLALSCISLAAFAQINNGGGSGSVPAVPSGNVVTGSGPGIQDSTFPFFLDPTKYVFIYDDFASVAMIASATYPSSASANLVWGSGGIAWELVNGGSPTVAVVTPSDAGTYGDIQVTSGATSGNPAMLINSPGAIVGSQLGPYNATTFDFRVRAAISATTTVSAFFGLNNGGNNGESTTDYIAIGYDTTQADAGWMCVTKTGGTATRTAIAGSTLDTNYHDFRIRATTAGTIKCSVDGGAEISISTNISSTSLGLEVGVITRTTAARSVKFDYVWHWYAITR